MALPIRVRRSSALKQHRARALPLLSLLAVAAVFAFQSTWELRQAATESTDAASTAFVGVSAPSRSSGHRAEGRTARLAGENLFERFTRVVKSNINQVVQNMEDPEKILDQAVNDMQGDLIKVRQSYAEVLATQRRLQTQLESQEEVSQEWYKRAELAVEKGDDELAKEALTRRQTAVNKVNDLKGQLDMMTNNVDKLFESVKTLEEKIQKAKDEKEQLIARARAAQTTSQVNEMLSDVSSTGGTGAFDRMKEKVETLETRAEVSAGMLPDASQKGSLEDRFKALESGSAVDDELKKLKGAKALPGGGGSAVDSELEALKKQMKDG